MTSAGRSVGSCSPTGTGGNTPSVSAEYVSSSGAVAYTTTVSDGTSAAAGPFGDSELRAACKSNTRTSCPDVVRKTVGLRADDGGAAGAGTATGGKLVASFPKTRRPNPARSLAAD